MKILRNLFGANPTLSDDGAYIPSPLALKLGTSDTTDYDGGVYPTRHTGGKRILMVCTQERDMVMANGKKFSTGNHPVEMALPMLHLLNAGYEIDVFTPTGASAKIEMWAMPKADEDVKKIYRDYDQAFKAPKSLANFVANEMADDSTYAAVFIPGGHGAMLGLPDNADLGKLLHWAHDRDLFTLAICHGPAALLAAQNGSKFLYDGYEMVVFPDAVDKQTPIIGYLPGHMPWKVCEKLTNLGANITNKKADKTCTVDRKLVTGASPQAANDFGRLAATTLLGAAKV